MNLRIKEICREKGVLQKELAERIGISETAFTQSIKGNPTINTLDKIAKALDVEVYELFESYTRSTNFNCPHCGKKINVRFS